MQHARGRRYKFGKSTTTHVFTPVENADDDDARLLVSFDPNTPYHTNVFPGRYRSSFPPPSLGGGRSIETAEYKDVMVHVLAIPKSSPSDHDDDDDKRSTQSRSSSGSASESSGSDLGSVIVHECATGCQTLSDMGVGPGVLTVWYARGYGVLIVMERLQQSLLDWVAMRPEWVSGQFDVVEPTLFRILKPLLRTLADAGFRCDGLQLEHFVMERNKPDTLRILSQPGATCLQNVRQLCIESMQRDVQRDLAVWLED